jgi:Helicase conserved C-terminal domain
LSPSSSGGRDPKQGSDGRRKSASTKKKAKKKAKQTVRKKTTRRRAPSPKTGRSSVAQENSNGRRTVAAMLESFPRADFGELYRYWSANPQANARETKKTREELLAWMADGPHVMGRIGELGKRLGSIFGVLLDAPRYECTITDLVSAKSIAYLSSYDLEASLTVLARRGLVLEGESTRVEGAGARAFAIPSDLGDTVLRERRARRRGIFDTFTLRGHLDQLYDDPARARRTPPSRLREMYKMYSGEAAAVARIERLPEGLRDLTEKVVLEFGGILPRALFERMETELPHWNGRRWGKILEESLVGTVEALELGRYGIQHTGETLIVFNEVTLAWLKRVAVPGDPDAPHDEAGLGVDLASNISRFLVFIIENQVRFTVRGEIFKTTEKRILSDLIPNPGRELERSEVLGFIYRFARHEGLIESTGERTFALTAAGRGWEELALDQKLARLYGFVMEEQGLGGECYHQVRMRQLFVSMLKRIEPGVWYDIMYLPFLARNAYLCRLDELAVDEYFSARSAGGHGGSGDDLQRMAWHLVGWVRTRLYLLGLVDLGYDKTGRPVAMRLTRVGARALGMVEPESDTPRLGNLVVTPDFEVVLFPTGDDAELTHDLDRFCQREGQDDLKHFRIAERSVRRALVEGMNLARMIDTLELNARTPVPTNVLVSMTGWATQAGLLVLSKDLIVRGTDAEVMRRFVQDPGVRTYVKALLDEQSVQLKAGPSASRMRSLLRELGYLIELESA